MRDSGDHGIIAGREALRRHAWHEAFEQLSAADAVEHLPPEDLELLAEAAMWVGRLDDCIAVHERAHAAYLERGNRRRAGFLALLLSHDHSAKGKGSQANGWMRRAEQLLVAEQDSIEYGHLLRARGLMAKDPDEALAYARAAHEIATRLGDGDLAARELQEQGKLLVAKGEVAEGLSLLEDAAMTAVSGALGPYATGDIFCTAIDACRRLADYGRASEWTDAAHDWCDRQGILGFPGVCRVYRAGILRLRGALTDAAREATSACEELRPYDANSTGEAFYELGEVRLRLGDLTAAEEAFRQAHEMGRDPQPGLALLRLEEGKVEAARPAIRSALADGSRDRLARSQLLPAEVEIALAAGDVDGARAAADELETIAAVYGTPALEAAAQCMSGQVQLAVGDEAGAVRSLRAGCRLWQELDAPYETARARMTLAAVYRAAGDLDTAALELAAARSAFERLGATLDIARAVAAQASAAPAHAAEPELPRAETRTFMFTDIVRSTQLIEAIGDEAWADLVHWHDQTLRVLFTKHGGEEIDHAGDGFFVAFPAAPPAIECGAAIQRTLLDHRRKQGFAPQVRIGLHAAPAQRHDGAYRGKGVHAAARIAALAEAGEILASRETVEFAPPGITLSAPRSVALKGLSVPLEIVTLGWR
jgi:class 3 adenylate cyclase